MTQLLVLDASAVLALIFAEQGADGVQDHLTNACMSSVNLTEVLQKVFARGAPLDTASREIDRLSIIVESFSRVDAIETARLRAATKDIGLSLGDRACLALAKRLDCSVLTADRIWADLDIGVDVMLIR